MHIHDPATGNTVEITDQNKLATYAVTVPESSHVSETHGGSFAVYFKHAIEVADTNEGLGLIQVPSNAQKEVKIVRVIFSHRLPSTGYIHFEGHVDPTTITAEGTSNPPINMNRGSNKASVASSHHNGADDMVVVHAGDTGELLGVSLNFSMPNTTVNYDGNLILRPGNSLYISCKSDVVDTEIRTVVYFYEHEIE